VDNRIGYWDKCIVLWHAGWKALRGFCMKPFLKKSKGILMVGKNTRITHRNHIVCGKFVKFEDYTEIHGLCANDLVFGDYVTISRGVMIRPSSYYGIDYGSGLKMGDHSSIGPYGWIGCSGSISIGSNVMIGPRCHILAENHVFSDVNETIKSQGVVQKGIVIEDDCWLGSNVVVLDGVTIGRGSVIGAGTIVTKDVPAGSIVVDKRMKEIRQRV